MLPEGKIIVGSALYLLVTILKRCDAEVGRYRLGQWLL